MEEPQGQGLGPERSGRFKGVEVLAPMVKGGTLPLRLESLRYGADLVWGEEIIDRKIIGAVRTENSAFGVVEFVSPDECSECKERGAVAVSPTAPAPPRSPPPAPGPPGAPPTPGTPAVAEAPPKDVESLQPQKTEKTEKTGTEPQRYGPLDVNLKPRDQLRPLLPTWNPPPTRRPEPDELEVSTRLRFLFEERWWAATVREAYETELRVGFDGWPSRHDQIVPRNSGRLYLHESVHPDYEAPPAPQRFQRPTATDAEGNPLPALPRAPKPKVYDPEKERMKRALRPPLPFNPEKEY
ncbi:tRNA-dihydrouridine(20) synthase [NAD(P)+] [Symbiodinium microadriaticum]|uniref:tRNA-dihydrouridine(20) synthase [NAD(P)+] n=1 Tax=Symbiodinium microadriaticum TaxID=2951 RepID=A0A1Q9DE97_SYMMI|nr:tRNA-dihydrouridine(20) synthase [NAD(P)+] [Symbiodinium microadriaticum]